MYFIKGTLSSNRTVNDTFAGFQVPINRKVGIQIWKK